MAENENGIGEELERRLREIIKNENVRLTDSIVFRRRNAPNEETVVMELGRSGTMQNMQDDPAAFEAWALILHVHLGKKVILAVKDDALPTETEYETQKAKGEKSSKHFHRFLYRVRKFQKQFGGSSGWFSVAPEILKWVNKVAEEVRQYTLFNNVPGEEASKIAGNKGEEKEWELFFTSPKSPLRDDGKNVYSQLPVGLKEIKNRTKIAFFPGGGAAIDLWRLSDNGETLNIYELKKSRNKKVKGSSNKSVGIVTELMFYANYCHDMFVEHDNNWRPIDKSNGGRRGYDLLSKLYYGDKHLKGVAAYMLTDDPHSLITQEVIECMNENDWNIRYGKLIYDAEGNILSTEAD